MADTELISKFNVTLKSLLHQGLSEPEFYIDLVYKFKKIIGRTDFSDPFRKFKILHKRFGYDKSVMRQFACLVINPITVDNFAAHFNCTPVDLASDSIVGWDRSSSSVVLSTGAQLMIFFCFRFPMVLSDRPGISICHAARCICWILVFCSS